MNKSLSRWNPRQWYAELRHVWQDTRLLVLSAQIAAIYAAVLIPFKVGIPIIPGFVELRPANVIPIVGSLLFGPAAAWGAGIGNVIGDCFGTLGPASLFGFLGNFLYGYVPYLLWGNLGWLSSGREPMVRSWRQGAEYVFVCACASMVCAATIGWGVELLGLLPFWLLFPAIFLNNLVMATLLGPPLLLFLYPRVKQWNLYYRDLALVGASGERQDRSGDHLVSASSSQSAIAESVAVSVQDVTFRPIHAEHPVLKHVSLVVPHGELVVLMGRSGSGKSSLCYALNGLVPQFIQGEWTGTVTVHGQPTTQSPVWQQANRVGMVFQDVTLFPHLDVAQNIKFGIRKWHPDSQLQRIKELLDLFNLPNFEDRHPHSLSGGEQQRIALARAMAPRPKLLLMDETFSSLDTEHRQQLVPKVREVLKSEKISAILVTHNQNVGFALADRIGVMESGQLHQWDTPFNIYHQPCNRFTARFVGEGTLISATVLSERKLSTAFGTHYFENNERLQVGEQVDIMLRPDDILHDDESEIRGKVVHKAFRGSHFLYRIRLVSEEMLYCLADSHHNHHIGEWIGITPNIEHIVIFDKKNGEHRK